MKKNPSFEEAIVRLEEIVTEMERPGITLERSMLLFEEGVRLTTLCNDRLTSAQQKISELSAQAMATPEQEG